jgi:hypothetical protein
MRILSTPNQKQVNADNQGNFFFLSEPIAKAHCKAKWLSLSNIQSRPKKQFGAQRDSISPAW